MITSTNVVTMSSSQGNNSYKIYDRTGDNAFIATIDPVKGILNKPMDTDGICVTSAPLGPRFPIIGVGGVFSGADARAKREAGADLVQIYSGLIYEGPGLVEDCARALKA